METFRVVRNGLNFQKNIDNLLNLIQNCIQKIENFLIWVDKNCEKNYLFFFLKTMNLI